MVRKPVKNELLFACITISLIMACHLQDITTFEQVEERLTELKEQNNYAAAIRFLENISERFPGREYAISKELASLYRETGRYDKCLNIWERGQEKGFFYGIFPGMPFYESFARYDNFQDVVERDSKLRKEAIAGSKTSYEVVLPVPYNDQEEHPLLIVLHGGGSTVENARKHWGVSGLNAGFIQAFMQSYLYYDMTTFGWGIADERARKELKECFGEIIRTYRIDRERVVIGGISAGGYTAMDISINDIFPTQGFIAVCPALEPKDFGVEEIREAARSGTKGIIISGEHDFYRASQKKVIEMFRREGFSYRFVIIPGMGHEYPVDFVQMTDSALTFFERYPDDLHANPGPSSLSHLP